MSLVSCHVQKYSQNKDGYTEYFILVLYQGREWALRKRFSDFSKFDEYLRNSGYTINYQLPEKNWWNKFDPTLLTRRLKELQNYLDVLLGEELSAQDSLVREFLEVDENMLAMALKAPPEESPFADRLVTLTKQMRSSMIGIPSHRDSLGGVVGAVQCGRNVRENSKYYIRDDSPGGTPRQRSRDHHHGSFGGGGGGGGGGATGNARGNSGSFSAGFGGALRIGIGSFSGGFGHVENAAQAVADAAKRETFAAHAGRLWLLLGKQTDARVKEMDASNAVPMPFGSSRNCADGATFHGDDNGDDGGEDIWKVAGGGKNEDAPPPPPKQNSTAIAPTDRPRSGSWFIDTLSARQDLSTLLAVHSLEGDLLAEALPKNCLRLGDPSLCLFKEWELPFEPVSNSVGPNQTPSSPATIASSPRSGKFHGGSSSGLPSPKPIGNAVGRDQLRRINSEGKKNVTIGPDMYGTSV